MQNDEAMVIALRSDATLTDMVTEVGHGMVPSGTLPPYLIVQDLGADSPEYGFGNREFAANALYSIEVICQDTDEKSAQSISKEILDRVYAILQNAELTIEGRFCMDLRRLSRTGSSWEKGDGDGDTYYIDGHRWEMSTRPA